MAAISNDQDHCVKFLLEIDNDLLTTSEISNTVSFYLFFNFYFLIFLFLFFSC